MGQSLSQIYIHIVFSTKNRLRFISESLEPELHAYVGGILRCYESSLVSMGGTEDHVHILCSISKKYSVSKVVGEIKKSSSQWMNDKMTPHFGWQNGYGAFSIGQSQVEDVKTYIGNQKEHHRRFSFREELLELLKKYQINYDEKYLMD